MALMILKWSEFISFNLSSGKESALLFFSFNKYANVFIETINKHKNIKTVNMPESIKSIPRDSSPDIL